MAASTDSGTSDGQNQAADQPPDRLKTLYPTVDTKEHPLPRFWSQKDKYNYIGLSQNSLRVHYKGESYGVVFVTQHITCVYIKK